jgi:methylase of polypeptide subunit release factors
MTSPAVPADRIAALRSDLIAAGLTVDALTALWGEEAADALHRGQRVPAERVLDRGPASPLATLARLFVLARPVGRPAVEAALPALGIGGAIALGLVEVDDDVVSAAVDLRPYAFADAAGPAEWWIISDLGELALGGALPEDHVLGVGGASLTLSGIMLQRPVDSALDLGTGCGIQAMHAARHARRVVATDISARALRLAALNLELNEIGGVELRLGSMFEPIAGERFDHIVSNPPFVITPRTDGVPSYEYRDGGMVGDELVATFVRECGEHLNPGGVAQLLGNWEYHGTGDGLQRVRDWADASTAPLDAWVIERDVEDAVRYAETWIRDGGTRPGTPGFERLLAAWLDDFEERGVRSVGFGYVLLRRTEGTPTLRRFERLHASLGTNEAGLGVHLGEALAAHDLQAALDDDELSRLRLTTPGDVTEERHLWPGADAPTAILLRQGAGFGRAVSVGTGEAALVGACDGELTVGAIVAALAQLLEVDERALRHELLTSVRGLLVDGFLRA